MAVAVAVAVAVTVSVAEVLLPARPKLASALSKLLDRDERPAAISESSVSPLSIAAAAFD